MRYLAFFVLLASFSCGFQQQAETANVSKTIVAEVAELKQQDAIQFASRFDFPVGKPDGKNYYNAQAFGENNHLGDDWNATTGGDSDLGDPVYSIAIGKVVFAEDLAGGWGKVIRVVHFLPSGLSYESVYAHCQELLVNVGDWISRGQQIATVGNADGVYLAHLHFEIRDSVGMEIGAGYSKNQQGYVDPTAFINANRKVQ